MQRHGDSVWSIAVSADGKLFVSGSRDGTIRRWDAGIGDSVGSHLRTHHKEVMSLAVSSGSELLISGFKDVTVRRWRAHTGEAVGGPLRGHPG